MKAMLRSKIAWTALVVLAGLGGIACWQREPVLAWHYVRQLTNANEDNREACAIKVASLDEAALPRLLDAMQNADANVCANVQCALMRLAKKWGPADPRAHQLAETMQTQFDVCSAAGKENIVLALTSLLRQEGPKPLPPRLTKAASAILMMAEPRAELRGAALLLAAELVDCVQPGQWADACRPMAERGLKDERVATRIAAIQLLLRAPMRKDKELLEKTAPLLRDPEAAVRRAVLVALASERDLVRDEALLPLLQDDDDQVQYLCEMALRKPRPERRRSQAGSPDRRQEPGHAHARAALFPSDARFESRRMAAAIEPRPRAGRAGGRRPRHR